jgi:23S rRNA pseudouridine2605 synthase
MTEGVSEERLQKVMARAGVGSRRTCEQMIIDGRVTINGTLATIGDRVDPQLVRIEIDGVLAPVAQGLVHYLFNKPPGVVTTAADPEGRKTVLDFVPSEPRVFAVGRLDMMTEGLLILTNDGDLAHDLMHPSRGVEKEYLAQVHGDPTPAAVRALREGVALDDGMTAPAKVARVSEGVLRITIHEGRNRQVRRMCDAVGFPVERLVRTRIGGVGDASLKPGEFRVLNQKEVTRLATAITIPPPQVALGPSK